MKHMVLYSQSSTNIMMDPLDSFSSNLHPLGHHPLWVYLRDLLRWQWVLLSDWPGGLSLLPRTRCCHGSGWGCAAVFASSICLGCQLGGKMLWFHSFSHQGVASILLPLLCLHTGTHQHDTRLEFTDTELDSRKRIVALGWTCFINLKAKRC